MKSAHINGFQCKTCESFFDSLEALRKHRQLIHRRIEEAIEPNCPYCDNVFESIKQLRRHKKTKHLEIIKKAELDRAETLRQRSHALKEWAEQLIACEFCGKVMRRSGLYRHRKVFHLKIFRFECDYCGKKTDEKCRMKMHLVMHLPKSSRVMEKKKPCPNPCQPEDPVTCHCGKVLLTKKGLHHHQQRVHKNYTVPCQQCGKVLLKTTITSHIRVVHGKSEQCQCPTCGKTFRHQKNLKTHMKCHERKNLICDFPGCGKAYYLTSHLEFHKETFTARFLVVINHTLT